VNEVVRVLTKAAKIIDEEGWQRREYTNSSRTRFCALGAIHVAHHGREWSLGNDDVCAKVYDRLAAVLGGSDVDIADWNDRQKSKRPVLAAFRRAAKSV
jgi:hypothetical protein